MLRQTEGAEKDLQRHTGQAARRSSAGVGSKDEDVLDWSYFWHMHRVMGSRPTAGLGGRDSPVVSESVKEVDY